MNIYFKTMLACLCAASSMNGFSQQYFRASANGGISTIQYSSDEISSKLFSPSCIGGGVTAEYIRFFNQYVGASAGVGASMSASKFAVDGILNQEMDYFLYDEGVTKSFVYNAQFSNWEERQRMFTVDIPVGAVSKYSFTDRITALAGAGVKLHIPVNATYEVVDGTRKSTGYYKDANVVLSDIPHQGFYTLDSKAEALDGDLDTKSVALSVYLDLGVMHEIVGQKFYYGIYGSYDVTGVNKKSDASFLDQFVSYKSALNTKAIEKARLLSFGVKIGWILPLDKNSDESAEENTDGADSVDVEGTSAPSAEE